VALKVTETEGLHAFVDRSRGCSALVRFEWAFGLEIRCYSQYTGREERGKEFTISVKDINLLFQVLFLEGPHQFYQPLLKR
jgi:hypothetical protein